ncbi:hypothetical protein AR457_14855 [Streptomyces agglomeratus]|uniref:Uncharacterized protein n=1 Tax=Streptomyces agglomeratus TaxID=285458 RepID=A0A1E5P7N3_9ACTN|nr:hypothetical protein [Streptomyces agglomeratus]OEJ25556.1 hypothetical protein AS594_14670 [Streptomyces agglomeratus]OEJ40406.1 hypothetical protein BGK70_21800 [Streptomyces agglomeratus]OEJ45216.1 hypothetical protein AR457_14855 [Streptomyces agglomeratus]OEJ52957.1 hypothetical protein BGK72_21440 [Streptomyces agglomeratus]OEJ60293.1 hypothetical protein BGM19_22145 [Streptomyces agglomeratus]
MTRNLWIGLPGRLREISQAATAFERGADLGVTQFTSLGGQVTTLAPQRTARKTKFSFDRLSEDDAAHLDRLARRIDGPGPVVVIDPVARNLLDGLQAEGRCAGGSAAPHWYTSTGSGTGVLQLSTAAGVPAAHPDAYVWKPDQATAQLSWRRRPGSGFPVAPGMTVRFTLPKSWRTGPCSARLHWKDVAGNYLSSASVSSHTVSATVPAGAALVTPSGVAGELGTYSLDGAVLTFNDTHVPTAPANLLPSEQAAGRGALTNWSVSGFTLSTDTDGYAVAALPVNTAGSLTFVYAGQKGHPLPGQGLVGLVLPSALRARAQYCYFSFFDAAGAFLSMSDAWSPATVPARATHVSAGLSFAATTAFSSRLGPVKLQYLDTSVPQLTGDGCPPMAVTGYTDSPARPLPYRNVSIDLTEVTDASV